MSERDTAAGNGAPATRGSLTITDGALATLARHAADGVPGVVPGSGRLGRETTAAVSVKRAGQRAWLSVEVHAPWPCPVSDLGGRVRDTVVAETARLTGTAVDRVDVTVHLASPTDQDRSLA